MSWIDIINDNIQKWFSKNNDSPQELVKVEKPDFQSMTKRQLETYGRTVGIELDRRHNKAKLIAKLESANTN